MTTSPVPPTDAVRREDARRSVRGPTRLSWAWVTVIVGLVLGIALVDFLVQNTHSSRIEFFSVSGSVPMSVALLAAALAGAAVVVVIGVARMVQLRRRLSDGHSRLVHPDARRDDATRRDHQSAKADDVGPLT